MLWRLRHLRQSQHIKCCEVEASDMQSQEETGQRMCSSSVPENKMKMKTDVLQTPIVQTLSHPPCFSVSLLFFHFPGTPVKAGSESLALGSSLSQDKPALPGPGVGLLQVWTSIKQNCLKRHPLHGLLTPRDCELGGCLRSAAVFPTERGIAANIPFCKFSLLSLW